MVCTNSRHPLAAADEGRSHAEGASDAPGHVRAEQDTTGFDAEPVRSSARLLADPSEGAAAKGAAAAAKPLARSSSGVVNDGPAMSDAGDAASNDGASSFGGDAVSDKDQEVTVDFRWALSGAEPLLQRLPCHAAAAASSWHDATPAARPYQQHCGSMRGDGSSLWQAAAS